MRISSAVLVALLAATLSACGGAVDNGSNQPGENVSSSALPPSGRVAPSPSSESKYQAGDVTLTGQPEEGVESGCIVLRAGDKLYQLIGGDRRTLMSGRPVTVRGKPNPDLMTTCQQGVPFEVSDVKPA